MINYIASVACRPALRFAREATSRGTRLPNAEEDRKKPTLCQLYLLFPLSRIFRGIIDIFGW